MATRFGVTRRIPGDEWLLGAEEQESARASVRKEFDRRVAADGLTLLEKPRERTDYNEEERVVLVTIRALVD